MKTINILAVGACALATVGMASATPTTVVITGSTAYRTAVVKAIVHALNGTVNSDGSSPTLPAGSGFAYNGGSFTGANAHTFSGNLNGDSSKPVLIECSWTGSAAGVQTVASTTSDYTVRVLPSSVDLSTTTGHSGYNDPTATSASSSDYQTVVPQIAMSDASQASTPFNGTLPDSNGTNHSYSTLTDNTIGIVPFVWVKSKGASASITNITPQIARTMWTGDGTLPLSMFSGSSSDSGTKVYATGRNADSGTRLTAFAESGIGTSSIVAQYDCAKDAGSADTFTDGIGLYDPETVNGLFFDYGQSGELSGGNLAKTSKMGKTGLGNSYVSYMSTGDAATLVGNGGGILSYNGVTLDPSPTYTNLVEGKYTFWGYEHLLYKSSLSGVALSTATAIKSKLIGGDSTLSTTAMHVQRQVDGGNVSHL